MDEIDKRLGLLYYLVESPRENIDQEFTTENVNVLLDLWTGLFSTPAPVVVDKMGYESLVDHLINKDRKLSRKLGEAILRSSRSFENGEHLMAINSMKEFIDMCDSTIYVELAANEINYFEDEKD